MRFQARTNITIKSLIFVADIFYFKISKKLSLNIIIGNVYMCVAAKI